MICRLLSGDDTAGGTLIGISAYTTRAHICRATLEAVSFQVCHCMLRCFAFFLRLILPRSSDPSHSRGYARRRPIGPQEASR